MGIFRLFVKEKTDMSLYTLIFQPIPNIEFIEFIESIESIGLTQQTQ